MGFLTDWLTDWLKSLLIEGILGNLSGLFDTVTPESGRLRERWEQPRRHGTPGFSPLSARFPKR